MTHLRSTTLATAAIGLAAAFGLPVTKAHAAVVCTSPGSTDLACFTDTDGDESKLFAIKADGVTQFFDSIGANTKVQDVQVNTNVNVDTDNGFGEVKPSKGSGPWTSTTFTPTATSLFAWDGIFVRGQIEGSHYDGDLFATITQVNGVTTSFEWTGLPKNADFGTLGVDEPLGSPGVAISGATFSLDTTGDFKSMKQFQVSNCLASAGCIGGGGQPPIPEPSTWVMMMLGFAGLGYAGYRRAKAHPIAIA